MAYLELHDVHTYYGHIHALKGVNIKVEQGQIVSLIGANGAGKTTTLNTISGIVRPRSGKILFEGKDITNLSAHRIVELGITHAPEGRKIFSTLTVDENLDMGAFIRNDKDGIEEARRFVFKLFPRLEERRKQLAGTLSGGEQQMLAIGRALMSNPKLLMLDEPSLGLAPLLVRDIFRTLRQINEGGVTILLVEQNARAALRISQYTYVMETGQIRLEGPSAQLMQDDRVRRLYLGEAA
jgi:branched-chain amino acid transport system ATP-binding protein